MATIQKKVSRGHTYWQIVESRRVNGKPRPIVLMHLGTANSLLQRLQSGAGKPLKSKVFQFGAIAALWNLADELEIAGTVDFWVGKRKQSIPCGDYILLAALNRCVAPTSKAALYEWYRKTVLHRLLPTSKQSLASQRFWDHMEYLDQETIAHIEEQLTMRLVEHFKVDLRTLLFDATNFDTFINTQTKSELAQRGRAKSKRKDLRVLGLALLVSTDFHIPLLSHMYPGNHNDPTMFGGVTESLMARYRLFSEACENITLVFDGGNTSEDNMEQVEASDYHFITSLTLTHHKDLLDIPPSRFEAFDDERLKGTTAHRTTKEVWGKKSTVVITRSEKLFKGQMAGIATSLRKKRAALHDLRAKVRRSQKPGARGKGYTRESLQKRLYAITKRQYIVDILKIEIGKSKQHLDFTFYTDNTAFSELQRKRLGKRILCTDQDLWSTEEIILGSRAQHHVEDAFKQMKNPHWVSFSPSFHWTDQKLRVHTFYCVLALTLTSLLQRKAAKEGIRLSQNALLEELTDITEVLNLYPSQKDDKRGRPRAEYNLSDRSKLQMELSRVFEIDKLAHT